MTHSYNISGMTCNSCVTRVKSELFKLGDITDATIQLAAPQAVITMQKHVSLSTLQTALGKAGKYTITEDTGTMHHAKEEEETTSWFATYKPILMIGAYITGLTTLLEISSGTFLWHAWMQNFMAAFFLVFSFFKILNLKGFADSYATYDIVAKKWFAWGFIYPFVEFFLGIAFLLRFNPLVVNGLTFFVMSVSIIGVLQTVLNKRKIKCACLGAFFNLPMSTITIVEDALMIAMSALMLVAGIS